MSSLRLVALPITRDVACSRSRGIIQRWEWLGIPNSCHKRPFSGNSRRTSPSLLQATIASVHSKNMSAQPAPCTKCVTYDNMNPAIKVMEYAVRGPLVIRASEIEKELEKVRILFLRLGSNVILIMSKSVIITRVLVG